MKKFNGAGALVTGGASGIGLAMAEAFARRGMRVVLCDVNERQLAEAAGQIKTAGGAVTPLKLDVSDRTAWTRSAEVIQSAGPLHVICANAGIAPAGSPLAETAPDAWDRIVGINLTGVFNTIHATVPLVKAHGQGGHLVLTSSMAGMIAAASLGDYTATKYAVVGMGETLRVELATSNIGVSILCPGVVSTPLVGAAAPTGMAPSAVAERVVQAIENNDLYVFTHADYRPLMASRCEAILSAFGRSADAGFIENPAVLNSMQINAYPPNSI